MMDKSMFREVIIEEFYRQLPEGYNLEVRESVKSNDVKVTGLCVMKEGSELGKVAYVEEMYEGYQATGDTPENIVSAYMGYLLNHEAGTTTENMFTSEDILGNCSYRMANKHTNQERLQGALTKDVPGMDDIVIYPVYEVEIEGRCGTVIITDKLVQEKGLTVDQIHSAAEANTEKRVEIISLSERLGNMIGEMGPFESPFYVTHDTASEYDEASVLGAPAVLSRQTEPCYIIPSSRHELLFLPKSFEPDVEKLKKLVHEVNKEVLNPEDYLSDNVYEMNEGKIITHASDLGRERKAVLE